MFTMKNLQESCKEWNIESEIHNRYVLKAMFLTYHSYENMSEFTFKEIISFLGIVFYCASDSFYQLESVSMFWEKVQPELGQQAGSRSLLDLIIHIFWIFLECSTT